jgi:hypothetical protein
MLVARAIAYAIFEKISTVEEGRSLVRSEDGRRVKYVHSLPRVPTVSRTLAVIR